MVLDHVPDGAGPVVEPAAVGDVERLGHRDLDALHVGPVEHRLDHRVGEPDEQHVLHRVEGQPVVDPEDRVFAEVLVHGLVELPRAGQVGTERLLHHDPGVLGPAGRGDSLRDPAEQRGRHFQVEQDLRAGADFVRHRLVGGVVVEVPVNVAQQPEHLLGGRRLGVHVVEPQRGLRIGAELLQPPAALRHPDDRHVEHAPADQADQRREGLDLGQVTGGPENHERINLVSGHFRFPLSVNFPVPRAEPPRRGARTADWPRPATCLAGKRAGIPAC